LDAEDRKSRAVERWQQRLLPFVMASIGLMAIFFFVSSLVQLGRLNENIVHKPRVSILSELKSMEQANPALAGDAEHARWKTLLLLEEQTIEHRYAQVNATLMLRAWTRHLGFLTGMILAFVGSIFILSKLSESETRMSAEGGGAKGALATSSPGIVLSVLGTVMMVVTLTANFEFTTRDVPVYLLAPAGGEVAVPPPPPLESSESQEKEEQDLFPRDNSSG
jgi:hypothetical protein